MLSRNAPGDGDVVQMWLWHWGHSAKGNNNWTHNELRSRWAVPSPFRADLIISQFPACGPSYSSERLCLQRGHSQIIATPSLQSLRLGPGTQRFRRLRGAGGHFPPETTCQGWHTFVANVSHIIFFFSCEKPLSFILLWEVIPEFLFK